VAQLYEVTEDYDKLEKCLKEAYSILSVHGPDLIAETGIPDKLAGLYSTRNNHAEAAKYAISTMEMRTALFKSQPSKETYAKYCTYIISVGTILANAGMFKRAEAAYREVIGLGMDLDPSSQHFYLLLEAYSNVLHQQGKTSQVINTLDDWSNIISRTPVAANNVRKIFQRMAVLYFTIDKFNECLTELERYRNYSETKKLTLNLQVLCELASVYWELGRMKEAQDTQQIMKGLPLSTGTVTSPITRSRYLATIESSFLKTGLGAVYHLNLRINRELPLRKENDVIEDPTAIPRRLDSCFLVITFEPTTIGGDPIQTTLQVTKATSHSFEIRSLPVASPDPGKLYEVCIDIYDNEVSRKLLGSHHQLIINTPQQSYRFT